jgi:hypothetical protein
MPGYPNRCQHIKVNGTQCGSPALRRNRFCFFHKRFQDEQIKLSTERTRRAPATFTLPVLEDANSIQISLMQVMRLLLSRQIEHKTASLLLYALQTASTNLRLTNFNPSQHDIILDPRDAAITPLNYRAWEDEEFEDEEEEQDETEDTVDRAIEALETARKKNQEKEKWMRWAERQYPLRPTESHQASAKPAAPANSVPVKSAPAKSDALPLPDLKKPASSLKPDQIRAEISAMVRKELPALSKTLAQSLPTKDDKSDEKAT